VLVAAACGTFALALAPMQERRACPHWQHMACLLDTAEKQCSSDGSGLEVLSWTQAESVWMCCCPLPYQSCDWSGLVQPCYAAVVEHLGPLTGGGSTQSELLVALQRARADLRRTGGEPCQVLAEELPHSRCGFEASPQVDRPLERSDLMCEMLAWQMEELGDGDSTEFKRIDCPYTEDSRARDGEARKEQVMELDAIVRLAGYMPLTDISVEATLDEELAGLSNALLSGNVEGAWQVYSQGARSAEAPALQSLLLPPRHSNGIFWQYELYHNTSSYADAFVTAAINRSGIFTGLEGEEHAEVVSQVALLLGVWMLVIDRLEAAVDSCLHDGFWHAAPLWDGAWAFIVGADAGQEGIDGGRSLWEFSNVQCRYFGTCTPQLGERSSVNWDLLDLFRQGMAHLRRGDHHCFEALCVLDSIIAKMMVPLIQSLLREVQLRGEIEGAAPRPASALTGWVSASSALPLLARCNSSVAEAVARHLEFNWGSRPLREVQELVTAVQSTYSCLGVLCGDVGGLLGVDGQYLPGMKPCDDDPEDTIVYQTVVQRFGGVAVALAVFSVVLCLLSCYSVFRCLHWRSIAVAHDLEGSPLTAHPDAVVLGTQAGDAAMF